MTNYQPKRLFLIEGHHYSLRELEQHPKNKLKLHHLILYNRLKRKTFKSLDELFKPKDPLITIEGKSLTAQQWLNSKHNQHNIKYTLFNDRINRLITANEPLTLDELFKPNQHSLTYEIDGISMTLKQWIYSEFNTVGFTTRNLTERLRRLKAKNIKPTLDNVFSPFTRTSKINYYTVEGETKTVNEWVKDKRNVHRLSYSCLRQHLVRNPNITTDELFMSFIPHCVPIKHQKSYLIEGQPFTVKELAQDPRNIHHLNHNTLAKRILRHPDITFESLFRPPQLKRK